MQFLYHHPVTVALVLCAVSFAIGAAAVVRQP